jgi:signal transduction histidine kinase
LRLIDELRASAQTPVPELRATVVPEPLPFVWSGWSSLAGAACLLALGACALHRVRLGRMLDLQRMRTRIATDLHDDIGSGLTQIAILSEVAERRMTGPDPAVVEPISRVSVISRELVDSMSEIVWAINPRNDRVQDLATRMRRFAADVLTGRQIALRFRVPDDVQGVPVDAELRRQVLLIFKEAIHNAVRHAGCREVQVDLGLKHRYLVLSIGDNGRGFDQRHRTSGHGLDSMEARASSLNGRVEIASAPGRGTSVRVIVPVARRTAGARKAS